MLFRSGVLGNVAVGYSYALPSSFNLAANVFYNFGSSGSGNLNSSNILSQTNPPAPIDRQYKLTNMWGVSVEPGYYLTEKLLGFAKLGWAQAGQHVSVDGPPGNDYVASGNYNKRVNGFLYGVGMKHMLTDHVFVGIEAYQVKFQAARLKDQYGDFVLASSAFTYGGIEVGYKF